MDWHIIISLATLALVVFGILWGNNLLGRRENVELRSPNMTAGLKIINSVAGIQIECSFSLIYTKGTRGHLISAICFKLDKHLWARLKPYFKIYLENGKYFSLDALPKLELGKPLWLSHDEWYQARRVITEEEYKKLDELVQELWHQYKIGWKDTYGKTHWKTINQLREMQQLLKR